MRNNRPRNGKRKNLPRKPKRFNKHGIPIEGGDRPPKALRRDSEDK